MSICFSQFGKPDGLQWKHPALTANLIKRGRIHRFRKRRWLDGYRNTFLFYWDDKEISGTQLLKYNPGQCTPGYVYKIKVNPRKPQLIATRTEIAFDYIVAAACVAVIVYILIR